MYQSSPFRSTWNTGYITALDMCEVCTEAVHSVALWTRVTYITALDMCEVCTEAVHIVALWTRVTFEHGSHYSLDMCEVCTEAVHSVALWTRVSQPPYLGDIPLCLFKFFQQGDWSWLPIQSTEATANKWKGGLINRLFLQKTYMKW